MAQSDSWSMKTCYGSLAKSSPSSVRDIHDVCLEGRTVYATKSTHKRVRVPSSSLPRIPRSVSFELDSDGHIKEHIAPHTVIVLTDEETKNLWWSPLETAVIAAQLRQIAWFYRQYKGVYQADFLRLFSECARAPITTEEGRISDQRGRRSARGLERHINEILPHYRSRFVEAILDIQSKMPPDMSPDLKAKLLRAKCASLSKPSRNIARYLAHQDEIEVGENTLKEFHQSAITI